MTTTRALRPVAIAVLVALAVIVGAPRVARADCAQPTAEYLRDLTTTGERSVFVGTVEPGGDEQLVRLRVEQVWSGPDLVEVVWVRTGMPQPPWPLSEVTATWSSVDADLVLGERYLVATDGDGATDLCSSMPVDDEVLAAAPPDARPPTPEGSGVHQPGLFDSALGTTLLAALLLAAGLVVWTRREARAQGVLRGGPDATDAHPGRATLRGVVVGAVMGVLVAGVAELATTATRQLFPTDVGIVGFALVFGAPAAVVVGALTWWRDRPRAIGARVVLVVLPVVLVGVAQVAMQWAAQ